MWIGCYSYMFWPLHTANLQVIQATGRSDITLKIEILKKSITVISLIIAIHYGVIYVAACAIPLAIFSYIVNAYPNKKLINYSLKEQFIDLWPALWMSIVMGTAVYFVNRLEINRIVLLLLQILTGMTVYLILSIITKNQSFGYVKKRVKIFLGNRLHRSIKR